MVRKSGEDFNEKWGVDAQHALYRKNGTWYHLLKRFPGALFDEHGYIIFSSKEAMENCPGVLTGKRANWLNVPNGIATLPGYFRVFQLSEEVEPHFHEGGRQSVLVNRYERDPRARRACIEYYGCICVVCDFDFSKRYGELGRGYIHIHHIVPLSQVGQSYEVDPIRDLRPVCPNCHAMLHRQDPMLSIEELRIALA